MEVSLQRYDEKFGGWLDFVTFLVIAAQGAHVELPLNFNVDVCVAAAVFLLQCVLRASEDNATGAHRKPRTAVTSPRVAPRNATLPVSHGTGCLYVKMSHLAVVRVALGEKWSCGAQDVFMKLLLHVNILHYITQLL